MESNEVLQMLSRITQKASGGSYLYRGETRLHHDVSSQLYRDYERDLMVGGNIEHIQQEELCEAKQFTDKTDDLEILAEIQHFGGSTNLIDFTTDFLIALFFACDGRHDEDGRLIFLDRNSNAGAHSHIPRTPLNRVVAQKSVFVRPPKGRIDNGDYQVCVIPSELKGGILGHLRNMHGIFTESIYNDLHGFIWNQKIHREAYQAFYEGLTHGNNKDYDVAIESYSESIEHRPKDAAYNNRAATYIAVGNVHAAKVDLDLALALNPRNTHALINRGAILMVSSSWQEARADLLAAEELGMDVAWVFGRDYGTVEEFEQQYNVTLPDDIVEILEQ